MVSFRLCNVGSAGMQGNRSVVEFSSRCLALDTIIWRVVDDLQSGKLEDPISKFACNVFAKVVQTQAPLVNGAFDKNVAKKLELAKGGFLVLELDAKKKIVSPSKHAFPITLAERMDLDSVVADFTFIVGASDVENELAAFMANAYNYFSGASEMQLLTMHVIINSCMICAPEEGLGLLHLGDPDCAPVEWLCDFGDTDVILAQEYQGENGCTLEEAGASADFSADACMIVNDEDPANAVACISRKPILDLTDDVLACMKRVVAPGELDAKPYRFTASYIMKQLEDESTCPDVAVVNWHAKRVNSDDYPNMFANIVKKMFGALKASLQTQRIRECACLIVVCDSNLASMDEGRVAASALDKLGFKVFNHTLVTDLDGKGAPKSNTPRHILVPNVQRDRRYAPMSVQWRKATPTTERTMAPKGLIVTEHDSLHTVVASAQQRATPHVNYRLDHGHVDFAIEKVKVQTYWHVYLVVVFIALFLVFMFL